MGTVEKISDKRPDWKPNGNYILGENGCGCFEVPEFEVSREEASGYVRQRSDYAADSEAVGRDLG